MVMELTIIPLGRESSLSSNLVHVTKVIEDSGLDYRMTSFGTLVEGDWDQLAAVARNFISLPGRRLQGS